MMTFQEKLDHTVVVNNSLLCVGLDPELSKLPETLQQKEQPLLGFNRAIIDATADLVCAFKPNSAYYEALGSAGIEQLKQTCDYIHEKYPNLPIILDAKRGDIGNTNEAYARYIFDYLQADAVTMQPYLGSEPLQPYFQRKEKGIIILCRTSNPGAAEIQDLSVAGEPLFKLIAKKVAQEWNTFGNCLLVVGATYPQELGEIRQIVGDMTLLVPGLGMQGGEAEKVLQAGLNSAKKGLIINSSRGIIFASNGDNFAQAAREKAMQLREEINRYR